MDKVSYTAMPQQERHHFASMGLSNGLLSSAARLFIAGILASGLVVVIILTTHRAVDIHPAESWIMAIWREPFQVETQPTVILERKYILCKSELSNRTCDLRWGQPRETEYSTLQTALDIFDECVVIKLQLDVREQRQSNASTWTQLWNDSTSCNKNKILPESKPMPLENIVVDHRSVSVYTIDQDHLFFGTPFFTKWQELFNSAEEVLYRCVRLLLVWRFGGIAYKVDGPSKGQLQKFKKIMDKTQEGVVVATKSSMVYSKGSCHSVIGSMLGIYAQDPLQNPHEDNQITHRPEQLEGLVYWETSEESSSPMSSRTYQGW